MNHGPSPVAASLVSAANFTPNRWRRSPETPLRQQPRLHGATAFARMLLALAALWLLSTGAAQAQSSATSISFQGTLNGAGGTPLPNGSYNLTFRFYTNAVGGVALGTTNVTGVAVANGIASSAIPVQPAWFDGNTRYFGISVNGGTELTPRVMVTAVPYAMGFSGNPLTVRGIGASVLLDNTSESLASPNTHWGIDTGGWGWNGSFSLWRRINGDIPYPLIHADREGRTVAIGASVPELGASYLGSYRFQVCGTRDASIRLVSYSAPGGGWWSIDPNAWDQGYFQILRWTDSASPVSMLCIDRGGNVGIGTQNPEAKLHVNGTARMTVCQITSDRNAKTAFHPVESRSILEKLTALPLTTWAYTNSPDIRHLGPVAQDFATAFALGEDDQHIATVDADGVALAAIQGLNQKLEEQLKERDARIRSLEQRLLALKQQSAGGKTVAATDPSAQKTTKSCHNSRQLLLKKENGKTRFA